MGTISSINLEFCKAFDILSHHILIYKLGRCGLQRWTIWWIKDWLDGHIQGYGQWIHMQLEVDREWCPSDVNLENGAHQHLY